MMNYGLISITSKANMYFNGMVASRDVTDHRGNMVTLGIMQKGKYRWRAEEKERFTILQGTCAVLIESTNLTIHCDEGDRFSIAAGEIFTIEVKETIDYQVRYGD